MDDELAIVLRENGFGEITLGDELIYSLTTTINGVVSEDFGFDFNDFFGAEMIRRTVEDHVSKRFKGSFVRCAVEENQSAALKYDEEEPRWHWQDLFEVNKADLLRTIDNMVCIVDEEMGGIVAYAFGEENAERIVKGMNGDNYGN